MSKLSIFIELWGFLKTRKKWWLAPIIVFLILLGTLIVLAEGSALAPFLRCFFHWYNDEHRHSGVAMMTPSDMHTGNAEEIIRTRQATMDAAYARHPERFVNGQPKLKPLSREVWINKSIAA